MPRKGFKTITVKDELYTTLQDAYIKHCEKRKHNAMPTFTSYVSMILWSKIKK